MALKSTDEYQVVFPIYYGKPDCVSEHYIAAAYKKQKLKK